MSTTEFSTLLRIFQKFFNSISLEEFAREKSNRSEPLFRVTQKHISLIISSFITTKC